mmetsp:Transcript_60890/g.159521  ORF Transcript_60890/g.159521 Transcript_60890/m.159521 type:complete len:376 (+) Transcript_60890:255-1382(+)
MRQRWSQHFSTAPEATASGRHKRGLKQGRPQHFSAALDAMASGRHKRGLKLRVVRRVELVAHVALLARRSLREDVCDASEEDREGGVEDSGVEAAAQEGDVGEVDKDHANGLADVFPDGIQDLEEVLVEERLQNEAGEHEHDGAGAPHAEEVPLAQEAILDDHIDKAGECPGNLQSRELNRERIAVLLQCLLVQHGHVATDDDLDECQGDAHDAEGHAATLRLAHQDVLHHARGGREEDEPLHQVLVGAVNGPHHQGRDDELGLREHRVRGRVNVVHRLHLEDVAHGIDHADEGKLLEDAHIRALLEVGHASTGVGEEPTDEDADSLGDEDDTGDRVLRFRLIAFRPLDEGVVASPLQGHCQECRSLSLDTGHRA